jgi:hypothetical protein
LPAIEHHPEAARLRALHELVEDLQAGEPGEIRVLRVVDAGRGAPRIEELVGEGDAESRSSPIERLQSPCSVKFAVSRPNQLMPVRRTGCPSESTISLPLVRR